MSRFDVAIVGSGFGGSILARALRRRGLEVALVERHRHPRFALGESSTPLAALSLERLAARYGLPDLHVLAAHGRWRRELPQLRRGLKRGFTFHDHQRGDPSRTPRASLLVAASPNDRVADCHWLRADVDAFLVERARSEGVVYRERTEVEAVEPRDDGVTLRFAGGERLDASSLVDASGRGNLVGRSLGLPAGPPLRTRSSLVYGHFRDVEPLVVEGREPYPAQWAAVHHLLADGWVYELRFDDGLVSAGALLREPPAASPDRAWQAILESAPALSRAFGGARAVLGPRRDDTLQHRMDRAGGRRWVALPHTFAFVDPLFSTGIAWTLRAVERLAEVLPRLVRADDSEPLRRYDELLRREVERIDTLVHGAYAALPDFERFAALCMAYFVTVSWAEASERLTPGPDPAWDCFLGGDDAVLGPALSEAARRARPTKTGGDLWGWIGEHYAPRDLLGLDRHARSLRVPVDLDLLVERSALLGLAPAEVEALLPRLRGSD